MILKRKKYYSLNDTLSSIVAPGWGSKFQEAKNEFWFGKKEDKDKKPIPMRESQPIPMRESQPIQTAYSHILIGRDKNHPGVGPRYAKLDELSDKQLINIAKNKDRKVNKKTMLKLGILPVTAAGTVIGASLPGNRLKNAAIGASLSGLSSLALASLSKPYHNKKSEEATKILEKRGINYKKK